MGSYAWLELHDFECRACGRLSCFEFQHKWGSLDCVTWYALGDKLNWDGLTYGEEGHRLVVANGIAASSCTHCGGPEDGQDHLDIFVENDVITAVQWSDREYEGPFAVIEDYPPGLPRISPRSGSAGPPCARGCPRR
ncbi:hypothetical protein [Lentzea sp. NEAU-D7]|uniref:hypothetical protein n=1 Tax=Lentzea sp. NEAU-D7 TaxID=2994667 RepID=UPI00224B8EE3|nr:hypothetical protein [Lentzea sp. NEAU-D7]MCX2947682.1 hypothetical protein [Lentzea sp. NEAU-D7]